MMNPPPDPNAARSAALDAIFDHPNDVAARVRLARLVSPSEAIPHLCAALRCKPGDPTLLRQLGDAYRDVRDFDQAAACYRSALHITDADPGLMYELGAALLRSNEPAKSAEALHQLQRASQLAPDDGETLVLLGDAYLALNRDADARRTWQHAIEMDPDGPAATKAWVRLARQAKGRIQMQPLDGLQADQED